MRRFLRLSLVVFGMWMVAPTVAHAHAGLEETDPVAGSYVESSPETIALTFDEAVITGFGSVRILDAEATEIVDVPLRSGATDAVAFTRRSASLPLLVMVMNPAATSAPIGDCLAQGWPITRSPILISWACASEKLNTAPSVRAAAKVTSLNSFIFFSQY